MLFLDASVILAAEDAEDPNHDAARTLLRGTEPLATLDLAYYETGNVAVHAWRDLPAAARIRRRIEGIGDDGGIVDADAALLADAADVAEENGISVYDAAYVAAARTMTAQLVSCNIRDLVSRGLAILPSAAPGRG